MTTKLRELHTEEHKIVCAWAMKENWPGLVKGEALTHEDFPKILALPGHLNFAMSEKGASILGFGQIWLSPNGKANLVRIIVDPAMRGRGLGKSLCSLLLAEALRLPNIAHVFLRVRRDNLSAITVYSTLGFTEIVGKSNSNVLAMAYGR